MFQASTAGRFATFISTAFALALLMTPQARGVVLNGVSVGQNGTGFTEPGSISPGSAINDLAADNSDSVTSSPSAVSYTGITYGSTPTQFNHITVDMYNGYCISGFNIQIATAPNPNPANNADWTTVQSYSGLAASAGPGFNISLPETTGYGVRVVSTDKSNESGYMRTAEIWLFDYYKDVAPLATPTNWILGSSVNDEAGADTAYQALPYTAGLSWNTPQVLSALMITGGSGAQSEHLIDYDVYANGGTTLLEHVVGNTLKTNYFVLSSPVTTSDLTLHVTAADTDSYGRVGEIWAFSPAPEPASMSLLVVGSLALLKRRR